MSKIEPSEPVPMERRQGELEALTPGVCQVLKLAYLRNRRSPLLVDCERMQPAVEKAEGLGLVEWIDGCKAPRAVALTRRGFSLASWGRVKGWPKPPKRARVSASG